VFFLQYRVGEHRSLLSFLRSTRCEYGRCGNDRFSDGGSDGDLALASAIAFDAFFPAFQFR
jgi:hypothetical protein